MGLTLRYLSLIGGQNHSQLVGIGLGLRRETLANRIDVAHGSQKTVGLVKEGVLPAVDVLLRRGTGIEVIGDVVERNSWFVIGRIQEVFEIARIVRRHGQRQTHEFCIGTNLVDRADDRVVACGVLFRGGFVLELYLVEYFPNGKVVVVTVRMLFAVFVGEAALGVPAH